MARDVLGGGSDVQGNSSITSVSGIYRGVWAASTSYAANDWVTAPSAYPHFGALVAAVDTHTSASTYNRTHWNKIPEASVLKYDGRPYNGYSSSLAGIDATLAGDVSAVSNLAAADRLQIVSGPARHVGDLTYRYETRTGDTDGGNGTTGTDRTEVTAASSNFGGKHLYHNGDEIWTARSVMFPLSFPTMTGSFFVWEQFFADDQGGLGGGGSPPFALELDANMHFIASVRGGTKANAAAAPTRTAGYPVSRAVRGIWHDFLVHHLFSTTGTGVTEVWHREAGAAWSDEPDVQDFGANVFTMSGVIMPMYPEYGIYRASMAATQFYYDSGLRIFTTRSEAERSFSGSLPQPDPRSRILLPASSKSFTAFDDLEDGALASDITVTPTARIYRRVTDGAMTASSAVLTSASANFASTDVNRPITVAGAGANGAPLFAIVNTFTSATQVTLSVAASTTVSNAVVAQPATVSERGGEIQLAGTLDTGTYAYTKVSKSAVVLTGKRIITELIHPGNGLSQGFTGLAWELSSTNYARFGVTGSYNGQKLFALTNESGSGFNNVSVPWPDYDPVTHRFLSIREASGTLYFESSPNCRDWTQIWTRVVTGGLTPSSSGTPSLIYGWYNSGQANMQLARFGMYAIEA